MSKEYVLDRIVRAGRCWIWQGAQSGPDAPRGMGYGLATYEGKRQQAHRVSYQVFVGPIPDGLQIDHTCRQRMCVNPDHLEPVTQQENLLRGVLARTHCKRGHEYAEGSRDCLLCARERWHKKAESKKHARRSASFCRRGHDLAASRKVASNGSAYCGECRVLPKPRRVEA